MQHLFDETPIPFRSQNGGDYPDPALTCVRGLLIRPEGLNGETIAY